MICEFSRFRLVYAVFIAVKMSPNTQRTSKDKPRSLKCRTFCLPFDNHNYCSSCREVNRGDDRCVTLESPCDICCGFLDEQMQKIKNRKHYVRKQKADTSKDDELDLLGDEDLESFTGSQADLEGAADNLFASPPCPCISRYCPLKLQLKLSLLPHLQLYNRKLSPNSKNPWVLSLTSNCNSKWGFSRLRCLRP